MPGRQERTRFSDGRETTGTCFSAMRHYDPSNPPIVQGDDSALVDVDSPRYEERGTGWRGSPN